MDEDGLGMVIARGGVVVDDEQDPSRVDLVNEARLVLVGGRRRHRATRGGKQSQRSKQWYPATGVRSPARGGDGSTRSIKEAASRGQPAWND